jgi:hypothetical protein
MNKLLTRSLYLFIIAGLFLLILFLGRSPFGKSNSSFASEPKEEITRIEFSGEGKKLVLQKKGESWFINGKSEARKSGVLYIIRILKEIKIKSTVSKELFESEVTGKNLAPVKVKVYEKRKLIKTFLVYKTRSNIYGNIMKTKESSKPFIVYVPGYEGDIGSGFIVNELFWKPYTVFNLLPSEVSSIRFENLTDSVSSFSIIKKDNRFLLTDSEPGFNTYDSSLVVRYVSYFAWIPFESWNFEMGENEKKSVLASKPLYRISVVTGSGKSRVLTLWTLRTVQNGTEVINSDRLLGKTEENDEFFIMRYFDIDPLIKKKSYFLHQ